MPPKTTTQNGQDVKTAKSKKTARSTSPTAPKKTIARKKAAPAVPSYPETLFSGEPNPYHEPVPPFIWIDHPQQNESLSAAHYVIRLGVGHAESVELSINKGPWEACRLTSGYWWYDWANIAHGAHTLVARMKTHNGEWFRTPERRISRNG